ncbi:DNA-binding transcriptional regulator, XRE-family HTH domain [Lachnospiraceae bacterium XBB2008]|nr:DNA-binding transcriptional regulator, XRE-family HTH domain [Lachnospiraceae bacterium XBB2008]
MTYPVIDMKATGNRIRQIRIGNKMRVSDISDYMGFEYAQAVYKWEAGKSLPSVDNLYALSRLFGVSVEDILVEANRDDEFEKAV